MLTVAPHPLLEVAAFVTTFPAPLERVESPDWLRALLEPGAPAPLRADDEVRRHVRDLLRHGGYKPTGRGKPASEYLLRASAAGELPSINAAVDALNVASLHAGLPISVIDLELASPPFSLDLAAPGTRYVFNPAGQEIDVGGLISLHDRGGACAGPVKDSQRTKTGPATRRTLSVVWGTVRLGGRAEATAAYNRELLLRLGARTEDAPLHAPFRGGPA